MLPPHPAGRLQQRAVATYGDGEVGLEVAALKRLYPVHHDKFAATQKVIVLIIYIYLGIVTVQTAEQLLDSRRLVVLINVAKKSKPEHFSI